jgi:hypothetical protein
MYTFDSKIRRFFPHHDLRKLQDLPEPKRLNSLGLIVAQGIPLTERRRRRKSLKKLIDDAAQAAEGRSTTVGQPLLEELEDLVWHEDEIVIFSPNLVDLPGCVYRDIGTGLKRRGFKIRRQREVELRKDRLMYVTRYLVEGEGVGEEAVIYARLHHLAVVETA